MIEDKLLVWRLRCGSSDALCRIYEKYKESLLRLASGLLNDTAAAEDMVHDVFVQFAQSFQRVRLSGNPKSYLATCVANRARNWNRSRRRQETANVGEAETVVSKAKRPEQWIIHNEELAQLNKALFQIPYEQREAVVLHVQGGVRFRVIANLQGVSVNTIQSRYRYGLEKLRTILDGEVKK